MSDRLLLLRLVLAVASAVGVLMTGAAVLADGYKAGERCSYQAQEFAATQGLISEYIGDGTTRPSLIPPGSTCTWEFEGRSVVLYPWTTGVVTAFAIVTVLLVAATIAVALVRRVRRSAVRKDS